MSNNKKILFTGGGSAGHVTLNLSMIPLFQKDGFEIVYIGSIDGIEKELVSKIDGVKYIAIQTGKLRRYFSWKNFIDMTKIPLGIIQAYLIVRKEKPSLIFSKGGFVSFPVVLAGWLNKITVLMHESDITPGLANKMSLPFVSKLFTTFEETGKYIKDSKKVEYVGPVVSDRFKSGDKQKAISEFSLDNNKPTILFMGGSLGAKSINDALRENLEILLQKYQIIHICGKGQVDETIQKNGYKQFEYINKELPDIMDLAEIVVSRAGSNSIFEFLSIQKPMILIPLSGNSSRGEQALNAGVFQKNGYCEIIKDESLSESKNFIDTINKVYEKREEYKNNMLKTQMKTSDDKGLFKKIKDFI